MIEALRSEWIKFSTLRSNWVMVVIAVAFPLVIVGLTAAFSASPPSGSDLAELIAGTGVVSALLLGALAILSITAEYGHNTIRPTFAALPDRWRALGAKPIAHIGLTAAAMAGIVVGSGTSPRSEQESSTPGSSSLRWPSPGPPSPAIVATGSPSRT